VATNRPPRSDYLFRHLRMRAHTHTHTRIRIHRQLDLHWAASVWMGGDQAVVRPAQPRLSGWRLFPRHHRWLKGQRERVPRWATRLSPLFISLPAGKKCTWSFCQCRKICHGATFMFKSQPEHGQTKSSWTGLKRDYVLHDWQIVAQTLHLAAMDWWQLFLCRCLIKSLIKGEVYTSVG